MFVFKSNRYIMKKETERENMRELTRAELEIMQILWDEKKRFRKRYPRTDARTKTGL